MAFEKKTWKDRQSEYPNRRILTATGNDGEYDISRSEGLVIAEGDKMDAENFNDLEKRIADSFDNVDAGNVNLPNGRNVENSFNGVWFAFEDADGNPTDELYAHWYEDENGKVVTAIPVT